MRADASPAPWPLERRRFLLWLTLIWLFYALIQSLYIPRLPLVMDEFEGAYNVHRYAHALPYRDFDPYKTVLGYYFQLPVLESVGDVWTAMLAVKFEMAAAVIIVFVLATLVLESLFARGALLAATAMLIVMSDFAERSADLRVDMLTALAGLAAFVALLKRRDFACGALTAMSVLISQKGAFYVIAAAAVLIADLAVARDKRTLQRALTFGVAFAVPIAAYLAFWSAISSPHTVFSIVFGTAARVALSNAYAIRAQFWMQTFVRNPLYWSLAVVAVFVLARRWRDDVTRGVATYGAVVLALALLHKQPWPYFFVIVCPTVFVLHAALIDAIEPRHRRTLLAACALLAFAYPMLRLRETLARDSSYQAWTVEFVQSILAPRDSYFAGVDMVWTREHEPDELRWLDAVALHELAARPPAELEKVARELASPRLKLVIRSYRTEQLPLPLARMLDANFAPLWGPVAIYAPRLRPGGFALKFDGDYRVHTRDGAPATIDGGAYANGAIARLRQGTHRLTSSAPIRLRFEPAGWSKRADPRFAAPAELYDRVYTY